MGNNVAQFPQVPDGRHPPIKMTTVHICDQACTSCPDCYVQTGAHLCTRICQHGDPPTLPPDRPVARPVGRELQPAAPDRRAEERERVLDAPLLPQLKESQSVEKIARTLAGELYPDKTFPDGESLTEKLGPLKACEIREAATRVLRELQNDWRYVAYTRAMEALVTQHAELTMGRRAWLPSFWRLDERQKAFYRHLMLAPVTAYRTCLAGLCDPIPPSQIVLARGFWRGNGTAPVEGGGQR